MNGSAKDLKPLLDLLLDQQCDNGQGERIEELLAEDPDLLDQYIEHLRLHSMLQWHCDTAPLPEGEVSVSPAPKPAPARRRLTKLRLIGSLLATTAVVLLMVVGLNSFWFGDDSAPVVGWISDVEGVVWSDDQTPINEGASFVTGEIRTNGGRLELQFKSGATMQCDGPITIDVLSDMRVRVAQGKISVRIAESAKGFVIETPDAEVIDLGTEFGVDVRDGKHTDVVVFDGEVDVQRKRKKVEDPQRLTKGEAVRVDTRGDLQRIVQVNRNPQADSWSVGESGANDSVIRSIRDNIRDSDANKYYEIVPSGFDEDALSYVDRRHKWNGLADNGMPAFLRGGDYVKTFNSDKTQSDLEIRVKLASPAVLYVLYDNRCPVPSWLSETFVDTDVDIGRDIVGRRSSQESDGEPDKGIDKFASVWRLQVDGSKEIVLGHVKGGPRGARAMYGIVAVPANRNIVAPKSN